MSNRKCSFINYNNYLLVESYRKVWLNHNITQVLSIIYIGSLNFNFIWDPLKNKTKNKNSFGIIL